MHTLTLHVAGEAHEVPARVSLLPWQAAGLTYTATGYGVRIPTTRMLYWRGRWRRVYTNIFSNVGTCYIGRNPRSGYIVTD